MDREVLNIDVSSHLYSKELNEVIVTLSVRTHTRHLHLYKKRKHSVNIHVTVLASKKSQTVLIVVNNKVTSPITVQDRTCNSHF